MNRKKCISNQ